MLAAVHLDDQFRPRRTEISDVAPDGVLPAKTDAVFPQHAQVGPQLRFGGAQLLAEFTSPVEHGRRGSSVCHERLHVLPPHPAGTGGWRVAGGRVGLVGFAPAVVDGELLEVGQDPQRQPRRPEELVRRGHHRCQAGLPLPAGEVGRVRGHGQALNRLNRNAKASVPPSRGAEAFLSWTPYRPLPKGGGASPFPKEKGAGGMGRHGEALATSTTL